MCKKKILRRYNNRETTVHSFHTYNPFENSFKLKRPPINVPRFKMLLVFLNSLPTFPICQCVSFLRYKL